MEHLILNELETVQYFGGPTAQITLTGTNSKLNVFAVAGKGRLAARCSPSRRRPDPRW